MSLTEDQTLALSKIESWFETKASPFFILSGSAGTGKSYLLSQWLLSSDKLPSYKVCFTAPTNKAVKVLKNYLKDSGVSSPTKTIYSLLGLSLQPNGEVKELTKPDEPVDLSRFSLIVVDEASMINSFLFSAIKDAAKDWNIPFLFVGDPAQLPPVGEISSPIWSISDSAALTQTMRFGSSLLDLAISIRSVVDHPFPSIKITSNPPVHRLPKDLWFKELWNNLDLIKSGEAKVLAWRNATVDSYNRLIRKQLFPQESHNPWLPGDKIVALEQLKDLENQVFMRTDEEGTILDLAVGTHPYYPEVRIFNIQILDEYEIKRTLCVPTLAGWLEVNSQLSDLSLRAKKGSPFLWKDFWKLKESMHTIRHSYSITTHRSQGSSYLKTFVDLEDILLNRNRQEAFRSLYVACTRAREEIFIC